MPATAANPAATLGARDFIARWGPGGPSFDLNERAGAQAHFIDLCRVLGVPEPVDAERYTFENGVKKTGSGNTHTNGFADVWLQGHFAWEYKAPGKSLEGALKQLMMYALPLANPPLLVVSDRLRIAVQPRIPRTTTPWLCGSATSPLCRGCRKTGTPMSAVPPTAPWWRP